MLTFTIADFQSMLPIPFYSKYMILLNIDGNYLISSNLILETKYHTFHEIKT